MIHICAWSESKSNINQVFQWFVKHFQMLLAVYISMSSIGLDVHVQVH